MRLLEEYHGSETRNLLRFTPVAVVISKSDLIKYVIPSHEHSRFLSQREYTPSLDLKDREIVDKEVREFVHRFGDSTILQAIQTIPNVGFFAVSSTGHPPNANGIFPAVEPLHCLDPLFWILSTVGFMR